MMMMVMIPGTMHHATAPSCAKTLRCRSHGWKWPNTVIPSITLTHLREHVGGILIWAGNVAMVSHPSIHGCETTVGSLEAWLVQIRIIHSKKVSTQTIFLNINETIQSGLGFEKKTKKLRCLGLQGNEWPRIFESKI